MTSPTNGQPMGPADLREARHQAKLAALGADPIAAKVRAKAPKVGPQPKPAKIETGRKVRVRNLGKIATAPPLKDPVVRPVPVETPMGHAFTITVPKASAEPYFPAAKVDGLLRPGEGVVYTHPTREAWMQAAVEAMRPDFEAIESKVGPVSISIGWAGGRGSKKGVRGQCWASHTTANKLPALFVTPDQDDALTILGIIRHEMNHAADDGISGHKGAFAKNAAALGFVKPWTSSDGKTPELIERLTTLLAELGPFPHGAITDKAHGLTGQGPTAPPVQTTRMLKVQCPSCGCILRMTNKWIADAGLPTCGCGEGMLQAPPEGLLALLGV